MSNSKVVRNLAIRQAREKGATIADISEDFGLGSRQVYNILSAPNPAEHAINNNGNGSRGKQALGELGVSGLDYRSGWIQDEFITELNSLSKRYKLYNEMRRNSTVLGVGLDMFALALRQATWTWEGNEDGDERTEFLEGCWHDMSHSPDAFLSEVATMFAFGFSMFELVYKRRQGPDSRQAPSQFTDGKIGWRKMAFRSQDSVNEWKFDQNGGLLGFVQMAPPSYTKIPIPIEKMLLFRTTTERGNPEGASLLRRAYPAYYYAKHLQEIEAIGAERDLAGLPVIGADPAYADKGVHPDFADGSTDLNNAMQIVRRVRQDEQAGLVIPAGWKFDLLSSAGGKQFNTDILIQRYLRLQALALFSQFLMLGMDQVGSYALSSTHADIFSMAAGAFADSIADTINRHAVPRLLRLNGMDMIEPPRLAHGPIGKPDIAVLSQAISSLRNAGVINVTDDKEGKFENYVREILDAPPVTEDELKGREERREQMDELRDKIGGGEEDNGVNQNPNDRVNRRNDPNEETPPPPNRFALGDTEEDDKKKLDWEQGREPEYELPSHIITPEDRMLALAALAIGLQPVKETGPRALAQSQTLLNKLLSLAQDDIVDITTQAVHGKLTIGQWERQMRQIIKNTHIVSGEYALAGRDLGMFERFAHWSRTQRDIVREFGWLRRFKHEIEAGLWDEESKFGRIQARAEMYANAGRRTFQQVQEQEARRTGLTEKRRVLAAAEHCPDCVYQASLDWVPIDDPSVTGIADGSTQCFTNCKCSIEYR